MTEGVWRGWESGWSNRRAIRRNIGAACKTEEEEEEEEEEVVEEKKKGHSGTGEMWRKEGLIGSREFCTNRCTTTTNNNNNNNSSGTAALSCRTTTRRLGSKTIGRRRRAWSASASCSMFGTRSRRREGNGWAAGRG